MRTPRAEGLAVAKCLAICLINGQDRTGKNWEGSKIVRLTSSEFHKGTAGRIHNRVYRVVRLVTHLGNYPKLSYDPRITELTLFVALNLGSCSKRSYFRPRQHMRVSGAPSVALPDIQGEIHNSQPSNIIQFMQTTYHR